MAITKLNKPFIWPKCKIIIVFEIFIYVGKRTQSFSLAQFFFVLLLLENLCKKNKVTLIFYSFDPEIRLFLGLKYIFYEYFKVYQTQGKVLQ